MNRKFPAYISQPFSVLWFELDDLLMMLMSIIVAQALGGWFWLMVPISPYACTKLKTGAPRGFAKHVLYYLGIVKLPHYPTFFEKEFLE